MFKSFSLKWKISTLTICILIFIMSLAGLIIYNYTAGIIKEQVNNQINIMKNSQKHTLDAMAASINKQLDIIAKKYEISSYVNIVKSSDEDVKTLEKQYDNASGVEKEKVEEKLENSREYRSSMITGASSLAFTPGKAMEENITNIDYAEYAYITLPDGLVIADSRMNSIAERENIKKYLALELEPDKYRDIKLGTLIDNQDKPLLLVNNEIKNADGKVIAYLVLALSTDIILNKFDTSLGDYGQLSLINKEGIILNHQNKELLGSKIKKSWFLNYLAEEIISKNQVYEDNYYILEKIGNENIYLAASIPLSKIYKPAARIRNIIVIITVAGIILTLILLLTVISYQFKPLTEFAGAFNKLKEGSLNKDILLDKKYEKRRDEIGSLSNSFNEMLNQLRGLISNVKNASETLSSSIISMNESSQQVGQNAEQVGQAIENIASGAEEQSAQVDETRDTVENLNKQIGKINKSSAEITTGADNVINSIERGNISVNNSIKEVKNVKEDTSKVAVIIKSLGNTSNEIGNIIELINSIAEQTNLLALNAAIEAARAGETGRGFSVVADEIRALAEESSTATEKIAGLINKIQAGVDDASSQMSSSEKTVDNSVEAIEETGRVFNQIEGVALELGEAIKIIADNTEKMAGDSREVENVINNIALVSEEFANNSEEIAASSEEQIASTQEIVHSAKELETMVGELSGLIGKFEL